MGGRVSLWQVLSLGMNGLERGDFSFGRGLRDIFSPLFIFLSELQQFFLISSNCVFIMSNMLSAHFFSCVVFSCLEVEFDYFQMCYVFHTLQIFLSQFLILLYYYQFFLFSVFKCIRHAGNSSAMSYAWNIRPQLQLCLAPSLRLDFCSNFTFTV